MCGRFGLPGDHTAMKNAFDIPTDTNDHVEWDTLMPRYNIAPTDQIPVIVEKNGQRSVESMRWGLIPFHAADLRGRSVLDTNGKSVNTPINARAETVHSNGIFKHSFKKRRCLIPSGGFYEWKRDGTRKHPQWVHLEDHSWMGFAGLYNWWKSPSADWILSCTIITTIPNSFMEPIHNRMPVILTEGTYDLWLSPDSADLSELKEVLVPYPAGEMQSHPVSDLVNKVDNDGPELMASLSNPKSEWR